MKASRRLIRAGLVGLIVLPLHFEANQGQSEAQIQLIKLEGNARGDLGISTGGEEIGRRKPPYFGGIPDVSESLSSGIRLSGVRPGSPAEEAGLQAGDIIVTFGGVTIRGLDDFRFALQRLIPQSQRGEPVEIIYLRQGQEFRTEATLKPRR